MLHEFLAANKDELVTRCDAMVAFRPLARPSTTDLDYGIPRLIDQLVETLGLQAKSSPYAEVPHEISRLAAIHGGDLLRRGFTLEQVVHDYGDLCQAITELAHDVHAPITVEEFHTFNRCLDSAIANAVTEFGRLRDERVANSAARNQNDRLALLATELRTSVNAAMLSFSAIKTGRVGFSGQTGSVLDHSLTRLSDIVERTLAEVRLDNRRQVALETIELPEFLEHVSVFAVLEAASKGVDFKVCAETGLVVDADRDLLSSAVAILVQNALRFTPRNGRVSLRAHTGSDRIAIEIEDECGGLLPNTRAELEQLLEAEDAGPDQGDNSGVSICRHAVNLIGGTLSLREIPLRGCVFTIELPKRA
ncbi:MAG TPA: HAMP domain-containing sensor histidine kinase [Kofleriaceae bacterium]|nr:HAMP domain-containing sensor histidine kinase [Kofleriaceae bacterium]